MGISAEEAAAAGLSQEEIDAINGVDTDQDDDALAEIAGDDEADDEGDDDDASDESSDSDEEGEGDDEEAAAAGDGSDADDGGSVASAADGDAGDAGDGSDPFAGIDAVHEIAFTPKVTGELLPDFAQAIDSVYDATDAKLDAIEVRFQDGELDEQERRAEVRKIERERDAEIRKLQAANSNAEIEVQKWQAEQNAFFEKYAAYKAPLLFSALNAEVIRLANLPEAAGKSGMQVLLAAKASIDKQLMAVTGGQSPEAGSKQKQVAAGKPKAGRPDVQTLSGLPKAAAPDTGNDRWAHLDRLTGLEYEAALSRLSETEQAAYLAGR